jgi:hypothetical protein
MPPHLREAGGEGLEPFLEFSVHTCCFLFPDRIAPPTAAAAPRYPAAEMTSPTMKSSGDNIMRLTFGEKVFLRKRREGRCQLVNLAS